MKKFLTLLLTVALTATLAITGTIAYLTHTDEAVNVMALGNVQIEQIELERIEQSDSNTAATNLQDFTPAKALMPAVGTVGWATNYQNWETGGSSQLFTEALKNVQDKFVFVKNTGASDAYVRTVIACEAGDLDYTTWDKMMHFNINTTHWDFDGFSETNTFTDSEGNKYFYALATYKGNAGAGNTEHANGVIKKGETTRPSLLQVFLDSEATNETCKDIDSNGNGTLDIMVLSQAVQTDGFADAATALKAGFGESTAVNVAKWFDETLGFSSPADNAGLKDDLQNQDKKTIVVNLTNDMTYDVAAWANEAMGGEKTEKIVINGNGHTLTFNQKDGDWNNIVTNGAKLVLNDVNITNSGHNDGPWNRHDLNFACDVEMNNVTSDKAFAFKAGAALKNVTINDANTSDTYAIWIQPKGQTVTLDGCTIDMLNATDGRGIKIDNQYVDAADEKKVTLVVKNTTFKTEEKSAILVKSTVGADITLENVDISGVAADSTNHVWVDEATAAYANLVTVTGGYKVVEP